MPEIVDHIALGYVLARPFDVPEWLAGERMPSRIVTASACLAAIGPGAWALPWVRMDESARADAATALGLSPGQLPTICEWVNTCMRARDWGWRGYFRTLGIAQRFIAAFEPEADDLLVLGLGLPADLVPNFLRDNPLPEPGTKVGATAFATFGADRVGLADADAVLGYEVLNDDAAGGFHSWMCNRLEPDMHEALGIHINEHGLIDDEHAARTAAALIERDDRGEPGFWRPWLLARYPRSPG